MRQGHKKRLLKTISWRIVATVTTMTLIFLFTGKFVLSIGIGVVEVLVKMGLYYVHEYVWDHASE